jgi:hypothetical protein
MGKSGTSKKIGEQMTGMMKVFRFASALSLSWVAVMVLGWSGLASGQVGLEVTVNRNPVRTGQDVQLTVTMQNFTGQMNAPQVDGLAYRYGPSTSRSSSWVNGKSSAELAYTWTYRVTAKEDIEVPPMRMTTSDGKEVRSNGFKLRVVSGGSTAERGAPKGAAMKDLQLVIEVSDRKVVVGEPLVASFVIYNRYQGLDVRSYELPKCDGFWKEEVTGPEPSWEPKVVGGQRYNVANLRTVVLFPQKTGKLVIEGFEMDGYIRTSFFSGENISARADAVEVEVEPLPAPRPAGNLGAFPRLSTEMKVSASEVLANQAFTVDLTFKGQGNLKFLREPDLAWPTDFEVFDPEIKDQIAINRNGETGARTFSYVVIPRAPGTFELPRFKGSYFDVNQREYVALDSDAIIVDVSRGEGGGGGESLSYNSKSDVQVLNQDIRYIITDYSKPILRSRIDRRKGILFGGFVLGPSLFGLALFVRRRRDAEEQDVVGTRRKRAGSKVRKELKAAKGQMAEPDKFYEAIGTGLEDYLIAKAKMTRAGFSRSAILDVLGAQAPDVKDAWNELLGDAEMARYAPGAAATPEAFWQRASELIDKTENVWKA